MTDRAETYFRQINPEDVPAEVATRLVGRGRLYIHPEEAPQSITEFGALRVHEHADGDMTYLANQTKTYSQGDTEEIIHVIDASPDGEVIGTGEVRYNPTSKEDYFKGKPFVGATSTVESRRNEGLATRRLRIMKLAAAAEFGLSLHSDTLFSDDSARKIWEHLVRDGLAERYMQKTSSGASHPRYRFK